jgi:hypothetical protein
VVAVGEPADVSHVGENAGGASRADAIDVHQAFTGLELGVQPVQVLELLSGHAAAGLARKLAGPDGGQKHLVVADGLLHRRTAGNQVAEQAVQSAGRLGASPEQPQEERPARHLTRDCATPGRSGKT